jgi:hypothetical protein
MARRKTAQQVLEEDPLTGLDPEDLEPPLMVEGDVPPDPSSGDTEDEVVEGEVEPKPKRQYRKRQKPATATEPRLRASPAAKRGAAMLYGYSGIGFTFVGGATGTPGLEAAGLVMQAQSEVAGPIIAKKALGTRWYPYLERMAQGGDVAPIIAGPIVAALYMQLPAVRPAFDPIMEIMIGSLTTTHPETGEEIRIIDMLRTAARHQQGQAELAEQMAAAEAGYGTQNGEVPFDDVPPPPFDDAAPPSGAPVFHRDEVPPIHQVWPPAPVLRPEE